MLDARRRAVLSALGIEIWRARDAVTPSSSAGIAPSPPTVTESEDAIIAEAAESTIDETAFDNAAIAPAMPDDVSPMVDGHDDWDALQRVVRDCTACELHKGRTQTVFGVGNRNARLLIIGEAPGADEDRLGEPFVGRAGQLLNAMLLAIGLQREQVYIANIVKCRPPGNRDPREEEAAACNNYLLSQIRLIDPALILSVGRVSAHQLLSTSEAVGRLRGRIHRFEPVGIPLIVTYHPAYLLRRPQEKAKAWADLQAVHRELGTMP